MSLVSRCVLVQSFVEFVQLSQFFGSHELEQSLLILHAEFRQAFLVQAVGFVDLLELRLPLFDVLFVVWHELLVQADLVHDEVSVPVLVGEADRFVLLDEPRDSHEQL